jgi:hypothetical protein
MLIMGKTYTVALKTKNIRFFIYLLYYLKKVENEKNLYPKSFVRSGFTAIGTMYLKI